MIPTAYTAPPEPRNNQQCEAFWTGGTPFYLHSPCRCWFLSHATCPPSRLPHYRVCASPHPRKQRIQASRCNYITSYSDLCSARSLTGASPVASQVGAGTWSIRIVHIWDMQQLQDGKGDAARSCRTAKAGDVGWWASEVAHRLSEGFLGLAVGQVRFKFVVLSTSRYSVTRCEPLIYSSQQYIDITWEISGIWTRLLPIRWARKRTDSLPSLYEVVWTSYKEWSPV